MAVGEDPVGGSDHDVPGLGGNRGARRGEVNDAAGRRRVEDDGARRDHRESRRPDRNIVGAGNDQQAAVDEGGVTRDGAGIDLAGEDRRDL